MLRLGTCSVVLLLTCALTAPAQAGGDPQKPRLDRAGDPLPDGALARIGTLRFRHPTTVTFAGYSGDGKVLITASAQHLHFWDTASGRELRRLEVSAAARRSYGPYGEAPPPFFLAGDGMTLALLSESREASIIDVVSGKTLRTFKVTDDEQGPDRGMGLHVLSHDGKLLVVGAGDRFRTGNKLRLWDTTSGKLVREVSAGKDRSLTHVAFSRDGKFLVGLEGSDMFKEKEKEATPPVVHFWNVQTGEKFHSFTHKGFGLSRVHFLGDGKRLLVYPIYGRLPLVFDAATGKELFKIGKDDGLKDKEDSASTTVLSSDGKSFYSVSRYRVQKWDLDTGKEAQQFPIRITPAFNRYNRGESIAAALSPDGRQLVVPSQAMLTFWDTTSGKELGGDKGHQQRIDSIAIHPQGKQVLTASLDMTLRLWDAGGQQVRAFEPKEMARDPMRGGPFGMPPFLVRGEFAPDGKTIAGLWFGGALNVWDTATGKRLHEFDGDAQGSISFAFAPDGSRLAVQGAEGTLKLVDLSSASILRTFRWRTQAPVKGEFDRDGQAIYSTAFAPNGKMLMGGAFFMEPNGLKVQLKMWEIATGQERRHFTSRLTFDNAGGPDFNAITSALDSIVLAFVFSPDGKQLAEAGFSNIRLWNIGRGEEVRSFGGRQINAATAHFSPDGKLLLAGKHDGAVRIWDIATGSVLLDFPAHGAAVSALAFSADGKLLATGSQDTTVLLWEWAHIQKQIARGATTAPAAKIETLWNDLAGEAMKAFAAQNALVKTPAETLAFLKPRLQPVQPADAKHLAELLIALEDKQFKLRQKATQELERLGDLAVGAIKAKLATKPSLETQRRLEPILDKLVRQEPTPELLQVQRAIEVLEEIDTPAARELLAIMAGGAPGHRVTEDARMARQRRGK